jgi:hypothetical protein
MGDRVPYGLGGRDHWLDMLGAVKGKVNASRIRHHETEGIWGFTFIMRRCYL